MGIETIVLKVNGNRAVVRGERESLVAMFARLRQSGADYKYRSFHDYRGATTDPDIIVDGIPDECNDNSLSWII